MTSGKQVKPKKLRNDKVMPAVSSDPSAKKGTQARARIIAAAEALFNQRGFDGASMRDISAAAEMQPASVYYYFESKDELLLAVWDKGGAELLANVRAAIADKADPWQRMEMACIAHTVGLLDWRRAHQALFLMPPWHYPESIKGRVIALRDQYEKVFVDLIDDLPLRKGVDRRYLRLAMIGVLSWPIFWFKKDGDTPATIAKKMLSILRTGVEDAN
jgi:TetR/AcrR family transcriptional regulator, cholesterol catabolism regulator